MEKLPVLPVAVGVFYQNHSVEGISLWMQNRHHGSANSKPPLWEFPGGKIERGEGPLDGLFREIREEVGIDISQTGLTKLFCLNPYLTTTHEIQLYVFVHPVIPELPTDGITQRWFRYQFDESGGDQHKGSFEDMPEVNIPIIKRLLSFMSSEARSEMMLKAGRGFDSHP